MLMCGYYFHISRFKMGVAGNGNSDMIKNVVTTVMQFIKKKQQPYISPCDGRVIRLYYLYTFWICMFVYSTVWYSWYHKDPMICISKWSLRVYFTSRGNYPRFGKVTKLLT